MGDKLSNETRQEADRVLRHLMARYAELEKHEGAPPLFEREACPYRGRCPHVKGETLGQELKRVARLVPPEDRA